MLASTIPATVAAVPSGGQVSDVDAGGVVSQEDDVTNNSSVQHERPDNVGESGDLAAVERWLSDDLSSRLSQSTLELSQGQYEQAQAALGDEYTDSLAKFVDVAGETDRGAGDSATTPSAQEQKETLNETRNAQAEFIATTQSFNDTYQAYQAAKAAGNESRARELARTLHKQGDRIQELAGELRVGYQATENITGVSLETALQRVNKTTENTTETSQTVVTTEFIQTHLTVSSSARHTSFTNPTTLHGNITIAANATIPPPNGTITLEVGDRQLTTTVTDAGAFRVQYRPVTVPTGQQAIAIQYTPRSDSIYLGTETNTSLTVTATTPGVEMTVEQQSLRFGQPIGLNGRVTANGTGVPNVPLDVRVNETTIATVRTDATGSFMSQTPLPASVAAGNQTLTAKVAMSNQAISPARATQSISITQTETNLTLSGSRDSESVSVTGQLDTQDGIPVPGQPVRISINGTYQTTTQTTADGTYSASFTLPQQLGTSETVIVTAAYATAGTNLENTTAATRVNPPASSARTLPSFIPSYIQQNLWILVGVGVVLVGGGIFWWRRQPTQPAEPTSENPDNQSIHTDQNADGANTHAGETDASALQPAIDALETQNDPDRAVQHAFSTIRQTLADTMNPEGKPDHQTPSTHWEFYHAYAETTPSDDGDLRELTTAYEQAKYAPANVTTDVAANALENATQLLNTLQESDPETPDRPQ